MSADSPARAPVRLRLLVALAFALLALLRALTLASDPWEWDEVLFVQAVEGGFDVRVNRPHPPGYPLYVEAARGLAALGVAPFEAATAVAGVASLAAPAGTTLLLVALGAPLAPAAFGGLFYALVPSIWIHAVRPLSDGPGAGAFLLAAAALVRAVTRRSPRALSWGVLLSAAACCVRPQTGVMLAPVALAAAWRVVRVRGGLRALLLSLALGSALSVAVWLPVVRGSGGWTPFVSRLSEHAGWVRQYDTQPLGVVLTGKVQRRWWRDPFGVTELFWSAVALSAAGAALAPRRAGALLLVLGPVVVSTVALSWPLTAPRYVAVAMPALAGLVALGVERLAALPRMRLPVAVVATALLGALAAVGAPRALLLSRGPTPSVAAMRALAEEPALSGKAVVFSGELTVHVERYLAGRRTRQAPDEGPIPLAPGELAVTNERVPPGLVEVRSFLLEDPMLRRLTRGRYRDVRIWSKPDDL
ncbi:hypothetical protein FBQ97_06855 [Acidobacteria bacterium ACD]|nr:MAG: hypothetical protein EDX89_02025 [Acidobacteriota bacterium]MDL1949516.1 hypothetical protein [Acidobacteria bacterium ACD]